jgi:SAM-dependent methyltransferase
MDQSVEQMSERLFLMTLAGLESLSVALGDRLGFYAELDAAPATADQLATRAGTNARWTREWLEQEAVMGLLAADLSGDAPVFSLAAGVAETLASPDALTTLAPMSRMVSACGAQLDRIEEAARTGAGVPWSAYGAEMREAQAAINKPALLGQLAQEWLPAALPDVADRLSAHETMRAADVGCGAGWSSIGLARTFPTLTVDAYDVDPATVALARANVASDGLSDRVRVLDQDLSADGAEAAYHFAVAVECIHDMPDPVGVLAGVRSRLLPGGSALVIDEKVAEEFAPNGDEVERIMYAYSTLLCLPDSMSSTPTVATGTPMRASTLESYARDAGFGRVQTADVEHEVFRFYVLRTD